MMGLSGMTNFFSSTTSPLSYSPMGTRGCPSGDLDRGLTNPRFSLQPRRPNKKFPGWKKNHKQNEKTIAVFQHFSPIKVIPFCAESYKMVLSPIFTLKPRVTLSRNGYSGGRTFLCQYFQKHTLHISTTLYFIF
jgi:hypothetical protein